LPRFLKVKLHEDNHLLGVVCRVLTRSLPENVNETTANTPITKTAGALHGGAVAAPEIVGFSGSLFAKKTATTEKKL